MTSALVTRGLGVASLLLAGSIANGACQTPTSITMTISAAEAGTVVALPGDVEDVEVAFHAALTTTSTTDVCAVDGPGCIVARRRLRFLPGEARDGDRDQA